MRTTACMLALVTTMGAFGGRAARAVEPLPKGGVFAKPNLVAWCIVPFDAKKRGPEERAAMLERLGIKKLAYDWRGEHVPTFDAEVAAMKRHGVEMTAWWFPGSLDSSAVAILDCIKRNRIHPLPSCPAAASCGAGDAAVTRT